MIFLLFQIFLAQESNILCYETSCNLTLIGTDFTPLTNYYELKRKVDNDQLTLECYFTSCLPLLRFIDCNRIFELNNFTIITNICRQEYRSLNKEFRQLQVISQESCDYNHYLHIEVKVLIMIVSLLAPIFLF